MRLTKSDKQAFVAMVMKDVPQVDYDEQAQAYIRETVVASLPPKVREVYDDPQLRSYLDTGWVYTPGCLNGFYIEGAGPFKGDDIFKAKLQEFADLKYEQEQHRRILKRQNTKFVMGVRQRLLVQNCVVILKLLEKSVTGID